MAIKIKKKSPDSPSDFEDGDELESQEYGAPELVDDHEDINVVIPDYVQRKASALEDPKKIVGIAVGAVVVILAVYYGIQFLEAQKVDNSAQLNDAFSAQWKYTEDGPEVKALSQRETPIKFDTFPDAKTKAEAVLAASSAAVPKVTGGLVGPAKLLEAGASMELQKFDEAIALYTEVLASSKDTYALVPARQGLSDAYAAKKEWDKAIEQVDLIAVLDPALAKSMKFRKGRLLESAGKPKDAKVLYHEIIENDPETPFKSEIERRLATL